MDLKVIATEAFSLPIIQNYSLDEHIKSPKDPSMGTSRKFNDTLTSAFVEHENEAKNKGRLYYVLFWLELHSVSPIAIKYPSHMSENFI